MNDREKIIAGHAQEFVRDTLRANPEMMFPLLDAAFGPLETRSHEADAAMSATVSEATKLATLLAVAIALEIYEDKVDGIDVDLMSAVQVAYNHGAEEWASLNYSGWKDRLEAGKKLYLEGKSG